MTTRLNVPEAGLSLRNGEQSGDPASKPAQVMRLSFAQDTLDELIETLREDQPVRLRLGKHPSLHYAGKTQSFHAYPETHRSEIYQTSDNEPTLYFAGVMSHSLEVEKAKQATAATDQALANLEESLNAFERGKESKKTHMIQHPDELKVLQAATAGSSSHRGPKSKAELDRDRLLRTAASRSLTSSPTLGAPKSPAPVPTPTSAPSSQSKQNTRLDAMKTPFIHLLAVRAVSTKFLARQTRSTIEDCATLARKYGVENRLNREKFDLKDKAYKDLDVWNFPYPTQEDRQEAIENAISAFDRMRISRTDKLWQMLLPKEERGKGKCLSRLDLRTGPIKKPALPKAQVDGADDAGKDGDSTGNETDRRAGAALKGLDGASRSTAPKSRTEKEPAKKTTKGKSANNSTLTGRVTKKTGGKPPAKSESKFKSSEYVHDSDDEDEDMPDAAPSPPARPQPSKQTKAAPPKKSQAPVKPRSTTATTAPATKTSKPPTATPKLESSKATSSKQPASRVSTSPQKPSPLGSSPPANASDVPGRSRSNSNNQSSSSSSSSPLISQLARTNKAASGVSRTAKPATTTNGVSRPVSVSNSLKRKAEPDRLAAPSATAGRTTGNLEHKRRRAVSTTSSGGSTGSASPPMSQELLRQKLWEKSQQFKQYYAKYSALHSRLTKQTNPSPADLEKLQKQHARLHKMKQEIWDEDQRLRDGDLS